MTVLDRVLARVVKESGSCWIWPGATSHGYGQVSINGLVLYVHRLVYETVVGPIPLGLQLDHLCRRTACCNPQHLEPVTSRENVLRGHGLTAANAAKTSCVQGHQLSGANLLPKSRGWRECRECHREHSRAHRERMKEKKP